MIQIATWVEKRSKYDALYPVHSETWATLERLLHHLRHDYKRKRSDAQTQKNGPNITTTPSLKEIAVFINGFKCKSSAKQCVLQGERILSGLLISASGAKEVNGIVRTMYRSRNWYVDFTIVDDTLEIITVRLFRSKKEGKAVRHFFSFRLFIKTFSKVFALVM